MPTQAANSRSGGQGGEAAATAVVHEQGAIDLADFTAFTFAQKPFGDYPVPCVHLGLLEAKIVKEEGAAASFDADLLLLAEAEAECDPDQGVWWQSDDQCITRLTLPSRRLDSGEREALRRAFGAVHVWTEAQLGPVCDEPCGYESFGWDGQEMTWEACIPGSRLVYEDAQEIRALLNRFAAATLEQEGLTVPDALR